MSKGCGGRVSVLLKGGLSCLRGVVCHVKGRSLMSKRDLPC